MVFCGGGSFPKSAQGYFKLARREDGASFSQAHYLVAILFLSVLSVVFGGFTYHLLGLLCGEPKFAPAKATLLPSEYSVMGIAGLCLLFFGVRIPHLFTIILQEAMAVLR